MLYFLTFFKTKIIIRTKTCKKQLKTQLLYTDYKLDRNGCS